MLKKIDDTTYKYKNLTVKYVNGFYTTIISLPRYAMSNKIYKIEAVSQELFIQQLNRIVSNHMNYEKRMARIK